MAIATGQRSATRPLVLLEDALHCAGCLCLASVLLLVAGDTLLRFAVNRPIAFQFELTEMYLMPAMATLSLARVQRLGGHLSIDFVQMSWFGGLAPLVGRLNSLLPAVFFALVTWQSGKYAWAAYLRNDTYMGVIDWPSYVAYASIPLGTATLTMRLLVDAVWPPSPERNTAG
ncbi:MAG: TRAP transporter small permease [Alphaproteobacteria bacterium]|nr:TRAP transporter small permease [Alphaproteobacteria bacterium]